MTGSLGSLGRIDFGAAPGPGGRTLPGFFQRPDRGPRDLGRRTSGAAPLEPDEAASFAWWDFSRRSRAPDRRPRTARAARQLAQPADPRAERLALDRRGDRWRHAPRHYAAIHFHEDDLYDCGWDTDFAVTIPDGMASGATASGCAAAASRTSCRSTCCRRRHRNRADRLPRLDLHLPNLRQPPARQRRRCVPRAAGRMGRLSVECAGSPGIRRLDLQHAPRRQRHLLFEPAPAAAHDASRLYHLSRPAARGCGISRPIRT